MTGYEASDEYRQKIAAIQQQAELRRKRMTNAAGIIEDAMKIADAIDADATLIAPVAPRKYGLDLRTKEPQPDADAASSASNPNTTGAPISESTTAGTETQPASTAASATEPAPFEKPLLLRNQNSVLISIEDEEKRFRADVAVCRRRRRLFERATE
jgi:hypothetical protein